MAAVGTLIYGIVPGDVEATEAAEGVGDPPAKVMVVTHDDVAALISEVPLDRPLGRPDDLTAYQRLLDGTATVAPVLPLRFGTVLADRDAVDELLADQYDRILPDLRRLAGRVEFGVRGRYVERAVLAEILRGNADARRLRDRIRTQPEEATVDLRMTLGEIVNNAVEHLRAADTRLAADRLAPACDDLVGRDPTHELDAVNLAVLVEQRRTDEFDRELEDLADDWEGRVTMRRLGPSAPYDFVEQLAPRV